MGTETKRSGEDLPTPQNSPLRLPTVPGREAVERVQIENVASPFLPRSTTFHSRPSGQPFSYKYTHTHTRTHQRASSSTIEWLLTKPARIPRFPCPTFGIPHIRTPRPSRRPFFSLFLFPPFFPRISTDIFPIPYYRTIDSIILSLHWEHHF